MCSIIIQMYNVVTYNLKGYTPLILIIKYIIFPLYNICSLFILHTALYLLIPNALILSPLPSLLVT